MLYSIDDVGRLVRNNEAMVARETGSLLIVVLPPIALHITLLFYLFCRYAAADGARFDIASRYRHRAQNRVLAHVHACHNGGMVCDAGPRPDLNAAVVDVLRILRVM